MQAHNNNIEEYLSVPRTVFVVPVYQRNYDWKEENCKQLFQDILKSIETGREHFLGTICFKNTNAHECSIIDGQQRLTSITLMLKAIMDYSSDAAIKEEIMDTYIYNKGHSVDTEYLKIKLHLNKRDDLTYRRILEYNKETVEDKLTVSQRDSRVYQNYLIFYELVSDYVWNHSGQLVDILEALRRLTIIELEVQNENPQEIFESLNSTGLDLTNADLLRNYFLMKFSHNEQTHLYEEYWSKIEDFVGVTNMEQFFTDYLIYRKKSDSITINGHRQHITQKTLYIAFKDYYNTQGIGSSFEETETYFADLKRLAGLYRNLVFEGSIDLNKESYIRQRFYYLIYANEAVKSRCLLLFLLDIHDQKLINDIVLKQSIEAVLSLSFRAKMCKAKGINYQFTGNVLQRLVNLPDYNHFLEALWKALTFGKGAFAFPTDEDFVKALTQKDLYLTIRSKGVKYLLYALEENSPFPKGLPNYFDETMSVDHIVPQSLSDEWKKYLSQTDVENYDTYLHRLGNLTLTNYNSEMSNKSFEEKKVIYRGSNYYYTRKLGDISQWSSAAISKRGKELAEEALKIWHFPAEYQTEKTVHDSVHTLDDDFKQFSYTKPKDLYVGQSEYIIANWSEFLPTICKTMVEENSGIFLEIARPEVNRIFVVEDDEHQYSGDNSYSHVIDDIFIKIHNSASATLTVGARLLRAFDDKAGTELYDNVLFTIR